MAHIRDHRLFGPTMRVVVTWAVWLAFFAVLGYVFCTLFFSAVEDWNRSHTPPAPVVTETPNPAELSQLLLPPPPDNSPVICTPMMDYLHMDDCPVILR